MNIIFKDNTYSDQKYHNTYSEDMEMHAPGSAPEWVKKAWLAAPKSKIWSPWHADQTIIDCNPNGGIEFIDGPAVGVVHAPNPAAAPPGNIKWNAGVDSLATSGIYILEIQNWTTGTYRYTRKVYVFAPDPPPSKPKFKVKTPKKNYLKTKTSPIYAQSNYEKYEYDGGSTAKSFKNYTVSSGTHTTATFDFKDVNPEVLSTLYGESAKIDPWETPEDENELPLWEQI